MLILVSGSPSIKRKFFAKQFSDTYKYCYTDFSLPRVDLGIVTSPYKQDYQTMLNQYKERSTDTVTLGGTFSKVFIDQVREDLGNHNVKVLNIVRHPTVSYVMNMTNTDFTQESPVSLEHVTPLTTSSILDNIMLSQLDYVTTIKFEDVLKNGYYDFDIRYNIPSVHTNYNGIITKYEQVILKRKPIATAEMVDKFNSIFTHLNTSFTNNHNDERLPSDIFALLGYLPITLEDMQK